MRDLFSRRRYELLAAGLSLFCAALHLYVDLQPATGLAMEATQTKSSGLKALIRGIQKLEGGATDIKFRLRGPVKPHPDVVVVAIDEKSAQKYGLWPWPRDRFADALSKLIDGGAAAIGLDITFTDEAGGDEGREFRVLLEHFDATAKGTLMEFREELAQRVARSPDDALEQAFKKGGRKVVQGVLPYTETDLKDFSAEKVSEHARLIEAGLTRRMPGNAPGSFFDVPMEKISCFSMLAAQTPLERFVNAGSRLGHILMVPDVDGATRRTPVWLKLTAPKGLLPSMGLQTAAAYFDVDPQPSYTDGLITGAWLRPKGRPAVFVPYPNNEPFTLINYVGPGEQFAQVSIRDVIEGTFDPSQIKGKAVLVGVTLVGSSGDQRVTPFKELEPGIFTHASLVSNILKGDFLNRSDALGLTEALAMLVLGLLLARLIPRMALFSMKAAVILGVAFAWLIADEVLFMRGVQLATIMPVGSVLVTSFGLIFLGYLSVDREKLKMRSTFSRYLGEDVMEEALKNPEKLNQGEKREMTVLFSDIRGFTTLSERMLPEKLASFINEYLSPMTQIVFDEKGTLDKYIGDAVMAFWNAPLDQADHALRACRASITMLNKLEELKAKWRSENYPEFDIGIGINTGPMIVGNMGSDVRVDYTVLGDAVNLASRLEGTNKEYETRVIFSEGTYEKVQGQVICRRLGAVRVKGKRKPVRIFELRGIGQPVGAEAEAIGLFDSALDDYVEQKFEAAETKLKRVQELWPQDAPTRRYLEELVVLRAHPPGPTWDGVYTATSK